MPKHSLLFASPFPPMETGISEYSVRLVRALAQFFQITLYTGNYQIASPDLKSFPVLKHGIDPVPFSAYDYRIYHIGNCPWFHDYIYEAALAHPGAVVLHEGVLYFLVVGMYRDRPNFLSEIYRIGGSEAISELKYEIKEYRDPLHFKHPDLLPLNRELLRSGNQFLVHSEYMRQAFGLPAAHKISQPAVVPNPVRGTRQKVLAEWGIPEDAIVVGSPGFVAPTKLNDVVCRAIRRVNAEGHNFAYLMIGQGDYISSYLNDRRIRVTGYVSEEQFDECLAASDLIVNLRYPTMGETSAALLRAMHFGIPCIVSDIGWFAELPNHVVLKTDVSCVDLIEDYLYESFLMFLKRRNVFERMGQEGAAYVQAEHNVDAIASLIHAILLNSNDRRAFAAAQQCH